MSEYDTWALYTQKKWEEREIEYQCELRQLRDNVLYVLQRIQNCWEHDINGSWLRGKKWKSHLFSLVFNDMRLVLNKGEYRTSLMSREKEELQILKGEGKYYHDVWCNADRCKPMGCDMCSCEIGRELKQLRNDNARLKENLEYWKDDTKP